MSKLRLALSVRGGEEMKVSIQRKPAFTVAGLMREAIESSECPETNQLPGVHRTSRRMAPETHACRRLRDGAVGAHREGIGAGA